MFATFARPGPAAGAVLVLAATLIGCHGAADQGGRGGVGDRIGGNVRRLVGEERGPDELRAAAGWLDPDAQAAVRNVVRPDDLITFAEKVRDERRPPIPFPRKTVLVISGGGVYGAYPAGVLYGWTQAGTRPEFDVVTGVSTGALVAVFAFLGPSTDCLLREAYTTVTNDDIFRRRRFPRSLLSESFADNAPLERMIARYATDDRIAQVAAEHQKGRRLYVGTTDLDVRRAVYWDMGAIAARGDADLFRRVLLASAAIPGFFPPVRIPVTVDGVPYVERHIDGGTTGSMFFAPPYVPADRRDKLPAAWLHGSDLYILVAGKMYPDPAPVRARSFPIASTAISTVLYDQTRSDLHKLFLLTILTGMNYNLSVIPKDVPAPTESTSFDPAEMTRLFDAGAEWARTHPKWRDTPPGYEPGEGGRWRAGTVLTATGREALIGSPDPRIPIPPVVPEK
jgi:predicted acylesterase/phospholipase RssA